jgi:phosphohistidine swiveling domain-containing protein
LERLHFADPMRPMDFAFMALAHDQLSWSLEQYGMPVRYHYRLLNHRWYYAMAPLPRPGEELEAMGRQGVGAIGDAAARLDALWNEEWLPEILRHLAALEAFDLEAADVPGLLGYFDATVERFRRLWQIHFLQTSPVYLAMSQLEELCRELFPDVAGLASYRLTQGLGNATYEGGRALWALSRRAGELPAARRAIEGEEAGEVVAALEGTAEGRIFLAELRAYLEKWGKRGEMMGLGYPSWLEDPAPAIRQLKDYLAHPERDVEAEHAGLVEARERALAELRARLSGYPAVVRQQFEDALRLAQVATVISEDHNILIDFQGCYEARRVLMALGRRLAAAAVLADAEDVFYLNPDELRVTAAALPGIDQRDVVAERRASVERARTTAAPRVLGTLPEGPPPNDPVATAIGKFFGAPPPASSETDVVRGHAGAPGSARGRARIIRSLDDAGTLRPGDVLVAETTAPPWTPLFGTVAAIVTDAGGVLSHTSVVAREYGIPAVVGTVVGTERIRDGQQIEVDGDAGTVRLLG